MYLVMIFTIISGIANATMTVANFECPLKFEGKVQEIVEEVGPSHAFATERVVFKNLRTLKGDADEQVQVDVLKHGPFDLEVGEDYQVQVRNGRVCAIEKI